MVAVIDTSWKTVAKSEGWLGWVRTERDEKAARDGCVFDQSRVDRVSKFFSRVLRHSKGKWAGKPFVLDDWQVNDVVGPIFGWVHADTGLRRFKRSYIEIPKKNGKSTLGAGIGLYMLRGDGEPGAEVYSAATKKDQASIVHGEAINMVRKSPILSSDLRINQSTKVIVHESSFSKYGILAYDAGGAEGLNIHCLIADELHVWRGKDFWHSLRWGNIARDQPLFFTITTAGVLDRESLGWQEHEHAKRVIDGEAEDDELYAYIRCATEDDDPLDPEVHKKANPGYGSTVPASEILNSAKVATERRTELGPFMRYRLNVWTEATDSPFDVKKWDACIRDINEDDLATRPCFGGLDLASKRDVAAWELVFPPTEDDPKWVFLHRLFVPKDNAAKREQEEGVQYQTWGRDGHMILTDGNVIDYSRIANQILLDCHSFDIRTIGADPWQLEALRQQVFDHIGDAEIQEFMQYARYMSEPTKQLDKIITSGEVAHNGNPAIRWMLGNVVTEEDGFENQRPNKKKSRDKIDGPVAMIMGIGVAMQAEEQGPSIYENGGESIAL